MEDGLSFVFEAVDFGNQNGLRNIQFGMRRQPQSTTELQRRLFVKRGRTERLASDITCILDMDVQVAPFIRHVRVEARWPGKIDGKPNVRLRSGLLGSHGRRERT